MKNYLPLMAAALSLLAFSSLAGAADTKTTTLTGTLECGKCALHETAECTNVLDVKSGTTDTKYYLMNNDLSKADHMQVCTTNKDNVTVTGTLSEKDGKQWLTPTKIDFSKSK